MFIGLFAAFTAFIITPLAMWLINTAHGKGGTARNYFVIAAIAVVNLSMNLNLSAFGQESIGSVIIIAGLVVFWSVSGSLLALMVFKTKTKKP